MGANWIRARRVAGIIANIAAGTIVLVAILWRGFVYSDPTDESNFEYGLTPGMTRASVAELERTDHGRPFGGGAQPSVRGTSHPMPPGTLSVFFTDSGTYCIASGKHFTLYFDHEDHLVNWTVRPWSGVC
jgi:hypothetical protein